MNPLRFEHPFELDRLNTSGDYHAELDVPTVAREFTTLLATEIEEVRQSPAPNAARKIHLLQGPPGYGKTHLFGRVQHEQAERVQFVFVSEFPDPSEPTERVRWRIVDALFQSPAGGHSPIRRHLASALRSSFTTYFDQVTPSLRAKCAQLRASLAEDPLTVLELLSPITDLSPYHHLADSMRSQFPHLPGGVLRALVLGLSPAAEDARTWLRGEAAQIPQDRLQALRLDANPPSVLDVLKATCVVLSWVHVPIVLCLDQLDTLLVGNDISGFQELTARLMGWLADVPNLVVVLGCIEWNRLKERANLAAFADRVRPHLLDPLTPGEARELVIRRMRCWEEYETSKNDGWPFDLGSVEAEVLRIPASPRGFINACKASFNRWLTDGRKEAINVGVSSPPSDSEEGLFVQEWTKLLADTRQRLKAPADYQDVELWAGVEHALRVAQAGQYAPPGVRFERYQRDAISKTPNDRRPSAELHFGVGKQRFAVVLTVSKKDGGPAFGFWYKALEQAIGGHVMGAVVVWPRAELAVGKAADAYKKYKKKLQGGSIRSFPLDANEDTFAHIECLRKLMSDAEAGMFVLAGKVKTPDDCRALLVRTKLLANLSLFEMLFENWTNIDLARATLAEKKTEIGPNSSEPPSPATGAIESGRTVTGPLPAMTAAGPLSKPEFSAGATQQQAAAAAVAVEATNQATPPQSTADTWADDMLMRAAAKLRARGQPVHPAGVEIGPTFVRLRVEPLEDTDFAKVKRQTDNLKLHLELHSKPVIENRAGYISIDIERPDRETVHLQPLLSARPEGFDQLPAFPLGVDISGTPRWIRLSDPNNPHLLVAGATGSGKSELLKSAIAGLAATLTPSHIQFILIDPKRVTFNFQSDSAYLRHPVIYDAAEAIPLLEGCCEEMDRRYEILQSKRKADVRDLEGKDAVATWVVVMDEFADLMAKRSTKKELEALLMRLGAKARASGIHLILGTQRPESSVLTPMIRNCLTSIAMRVSSERESRLVLDQPDAAYLLGRGDLLWRSGGGLVRLQSPFVTPEELSRYLRIK